MCQENGWEGQSARNEWQSFKEHNKNNINELSYDWEGNQNKLSHSTATQGPMDLAPSWLQVAARPEPFSLWTQRHHSEANEKRVERNTISRRLPSFVTTKITSLHFSLGKCHTSRNLIYSFWTILKDFGKKASKTIQRPHRHTESTYCNQHSLLEDLLWPGPTDQVAAVAAETLHKSFVIHLLQRVHQQLPPAAGDPIMFSQGPKGKQRKKKVGCRVSRMIASCVVPSPKALPASAAGRLSPHDPPCSLASAGAKRCVMILIHEY